MQFALGSRRSAFPGSFSSPKPALNPAFTHRPLGRLQRKHWVSASVEKEPKAESAAAPAEATDVESAAPPANVAEAGSAAASPEADAAENSAPPAEATKADEPKGARYIDELEPIKRTPLSAGMKDRMQKEYMGLGGAENTAMGANWFLIIGVTIAVLAIASKLTGAI